MLHSKLLSLFTLLPAVLAASPYSGAYIAARMDIKRAAPPTFFYNVHPNGNKKKCMQVRGGASVADNTVVEISDCGSGSPAQMWSVPDSNDHGFIKLANTNFCLDAGTNPHSRVPSKVYTCYNNTNGGGPIVAQDWAHTPDQRLALMSKTIKPGQCLDMTNGNLKNGQALQTYQCTSGNTNQVWTVTRVG